MRSRFSLNRAAISADSHPQQFKKQARTPEGCAGLFRFMIGNDLRRDRSDPRS